MKVTIYVTEEIIAASTPGLPLTCAVDRSLDVALRASGQGGIQAGVFFATDKRALAIALFRNDGELVPLYAELGDLTTGRIRHYDATGEMEPFRQEIEFNREVPWDVFNKAMAQQKVYKQQREERRRLQNPEAQPAAPQPT